MLLLSCVLPACSRSMSSQGTWAGRMSPLARRSHAFAAPSEEAAHLGGQVDDVAPVHVAVHEACVRAGGALGRCVLGL